MLHNGQYHSPTGSSSSGGENGPTHNGNQQSGSGAQHNPLSDLTPEDFQLLAKGHW